MTDSYFHEDTVISVLTRDVMDRMLDYRAPAGGCHAGAFVQVPLGPRKVVGVVWGPGQGNWDRAKLRQVLGVLDVVPMRAELRDFLDRAAGYTLTSQGAMLRLATRVPGLGQPPSEQILYHLGTAPAPRLTKARQQVLEVLETQGDQGLSLSELSEMAGVSTSVIKGLASFGTLEARTAPRDAPYPRLDPNKPGKPLTDDQAAAVDQLRIQAKAGGYGTTLLKGVTGSGKTEVYLESIAACLTQGRQALVLLPEIALTAEFLTRVERRFGAKPAEWHTGVTQATRRRCWNMVAQGRAQLVVGARSALFLPFQDLGLIIVDEEHDGSYKQEEGVIYNARDMAVLRASLNGAQVVLASATPSLETWANAQSGKYGRLDLPKRFGAAVMPLLRAVDMRTQDVPGGRWVSPTLQGEIKKRLEIGEQSLLFLNRRGYAPVTICRACGVQVGCDLCDARMTEHRFQNRLICHQCGATKPIPDTCPACGAEGKMAALGPGVERIAEEAATLFPDAKQAVLSSDLFASARALKDRVQDIATGDIDIIIGTQLVAKGHNFPRLTLVGVVDADLGLHGSDLRAAEHTFQLIRQVAGRAGRVDTPGLALLQSYQPDHPVMQAILSGDDEGFWQAEATERESAGMPPYGRLAGVVISSPDASTAFDLGTYLARNAQALTQAGAQVFGPAPAPIARVRGRHRVRLLIKAPKQTPLQTAISAWLAGVKYPKNLRLSVDIDPQSFY